MHDSQVFGKILDPANEGNGVWADSAYRSAERIEWLFRNGYEPHLQRKAQRGVPLTEWQRLGNRIRSRIRSRVEHIFGVQARRMGDTILRGIGIGRARCRIGLRNLAYNLTRYALLVQTA